MKLLFIGTGAADWVLKDRKAGEFFRRLTAVKINDDLMIDCSPDTLDYAEKNTEDLKNIKNMLITHTHSDHYSPDAIRALFGQNIRVWAEKAAENMIMHDMPELCESTLEMFKENSVGGYGVIPVPSGHSVADTDQTPVNYIITYRDKRIFWGCDGAWLPNRSWHEIKKYKYDLFVLDGTLGNAYGDYRIFEHNNLAMIHEIAGVIKNCGLLKDGGKIMISHMSRYSHEEHGKLQKQLDKDGIVAAYDELEIEI